MPKTFAVGDTVWAQWPGSRKYYEATVLDVGKTQVQVDFKDGYKTEVPLRNTYVRLVLKLLEYCRPCRLLSYEELKLIIVKGRDRSRNVILRTKSFGRRHFDSVVVVDVTCMRTPFAVSY